MQFYEGVTVAILIHSLMLGFQLGLLPVLLRLVKYSGAFLFISYVLPSLTIHLLNTLGLKQTLYFSLQDLINYKEGEERVYAGGVLVVAEVRKNLVFLVEQLQLSTRWEEFLLFFLEEEQRTAFFTEVVPEDLSLLYPSQVSLHIFCHTAAFYLLFSLLALFSLFFFSLLLETAFSGVKGQLSSIGERLLAALLNFFLTVFLLLFLLQVSLPLLEFFTISIPPGPLLHYLSPLLSVFTHWHQLLIL